MLTVNQMGTFKTSDLTSEVDGWIKALRNHNFEDLMGRSGQSIRSQHYFCVVDIIRIGGSVSL